MSSPSSPIVFAGPSLEGLPPGLRERLDVRPPVRRGDLERLLQSEHAPQKVLLLDGFFGGSLAVTPTECRELMFAGWTVMGAASIGALRAAELWSLGMIGVGEIFMMLRLDVVQSDAEVAVAYHPDTYDELTVSLVHLRSVLSEMERVDGTFSSNTFDRAFRCGQECYWMERSIVRLVRAWREAGLEDSFSSAARALLSDPLHHPKVRDAHSAVRAILADRWL